MVLKRECDLQKEDVILSGTIKSSSIVAEDAINELVGVNTHAMNNYQIEFGYTEGISGMTAAQDTANQMLQAIGSFSSAVLEQANKFPEIAFKIEKRDIEEAKRWKDNNDS